MNRLADEYGNNTLNTPRWALNKMFAHPTKNRDTQFEYVPYAQRVLPVLCDIIREMERLERRPLEPF
jgi:hypothetical protein